jgi:hypothetical protein
MAAFKFTMVIRRVDYGADTLRELSAIYCRVRDATGEGASTFRPVDVREDDKHIGYLSYNGRIWEGRPANWNGNSTKLIYDNSAGNT